MKAAARTPNARAPQEVRIVGGLWKRSKLPVIERPGLRPTPARVRETLFNWLGQSLPGWRCLDAFAGTGALGLEAASRGAAEVILVEHDAALVKNLLALKARFQADAVRVEKGDALAALTQRSGQGLDLVLLDPPFAQGSNDALFTAALLAARQCVRMEGRVYLEAPRPWPADELALLGLHALREGRAGQVFFHLLEPLPPQ